MWDKISIFGFQALWSPYFLVFCSLIVIGYYMLIRQYEEKVPVEKRVTIKQQVYFITSILLLYIAKGSPVDLLGHIMFTAHMTQMAVLYIVVTPLFILGLPYWIHEKIMNYKIVDTIFKSVGHPLLALFIFNGVFSLYHIPSIFDIVKTNVVFHSIYILSMFIASYLLWWPVLNPISERQSLSYLQKIAYMFGNGMLLTPACALIIFASKPLYLTYTDPLMWGQAMELCVSPSILSDLNLTGPEFFSGISALEDQRTGGVAMKILQEVVYGLIIGYVFFKWIRNEKSNSSLKEEIPEYVKIQLLEKERLRNERSNITNN